MRAALVLALALIGTAGATAILPAALPGGLLGLVGTPAADAAGDAHAGHKHVHGAADGMEGMEGMDSHAAHGAGDAHAHGSELWHPEDFSWSAPGGRLPAVNDAALRDLRSLTAHGDRGLAELAAKGFLKGAGTRGDPFVIEGLHVQQNLDLQDLTGYVILRNNVIGGKLQLNYDGHTIHAHHNRIHDLRINENVKRSGDTSGGLWEHNNISFIGQMRHFEGEFRDNTVGPKGSGPFEDFLGDSGPLGFEDQEVWNFDGFELAHVHDNTVDGMVNVKLHGHEHGSCTLCLPHEHDQAEGKDMGVNHQERYSTLWFYNNTIKVPTGPALIYRDQAHAGDDRTANSEPHPELELPHAHHTHIELTGNRLTGGGLVVRIFGAADPRHVNGSDGLLRIAGNVVDFPAPSGGASFLSRAGGTGFDLHDANGVDLQLVDNVVTFGGAAGAPASAPGALPPGIFGGAPGGAQPHGVGFLLRGWDASQMTIAGNAVHGAAVGVRARDFDQATHWGLTANTWDAETPVDYDGSVANEPK